MLLDGLQENIGMARFATISGGTSIASGQKRTRNPIGALKELAGTVEQAGTLGQIVKTSDGFFKKVIAVATIASLAKPAFDTVLSGFPEARANKQQRHQHQMDRVQESKKPVQLSGVNSQVKEINGTKTKFCDDSSECFEGEASEPDANGSFTLTLSSGNKLENCRVNSAGRKVCVRNGREFKEK